MERKNKRQKDENEEAKLKKEEKVRSSRRESKKG